MSDPWTVYIIQAENGSYYTGITKDLPRRWKEHVSGKRGARFFRSSSPKEIVYQEQVKSRSEASKREIFIKSLSRDQKKQLILG